LREWWERDLTERPDIQRCRERQDRERQDRERERQRERDRERDRQGETRTDLLVVAVRVIRVGWQAIAERRAGRSPLAARRLPGRGRPMAGVPGWRHLHGPTAPLR
jgi:hypothetical protein